MKAIDFSHDGGYPLTQDDLDYLQQAYTECISSMTAVVDSTTAIILAGMGSTFGLGVTTIAAGYFLYNGKIVRFTGGTYGALSVGTVVLVVITPNATDLTYDDSSIYPAILESTAGLTTGAAVTDATHFPLNNMISYATAFALASNSSVWPAPIRASAGSGIYAGTFDDDSSSPITYRKAVGSNMVELAGVTNNSAGASSIGGSTLMMTLPVGYRPAHDRHFSCRGSNAGAFAMIAVDIIAASGAVKIQGTLTPFDNQGVSMDGISFATD